MKPGFSDTLRTCLWIGNAVVLPLLPIASVLAGILPPAPLPSYQKGDVFVYFDGSKDSTTEVVGIDGDLIRFRDPDSQSTWSYFRNFALPTPQSRPDASSKQTTQYFFGEISRFFPLRVGNTMDFSVEGHDEGSTDGWRYNNHCEVVEKMELAVRAGRFDTYRVECNADQWNWVRTYFYAPREELLVKEVSSADGQPMMVRELVSFKKANRQDNW